MSGSWSLLPRQFSQQSLAIVAQQEYPHPRAQAQPMIAGLIGMANEPCHGVSSHNSDFTKGIQELRFDDER